MYPTLEILRRPRRFFSALCLIAVTASTASAQCYQFSGSGATLQIDITSFVTRFDDQASSSGYTSKDTFQGNNSLTVGGATKTSQSTANTPDCVGCLLGSAVFSYSGGGDNQTVFTMSVPADDIPGDMNAWFVTLGGIGNQFPTGVLPSPQAFPPIASWFDAQITVAVGSNLNQYTVTSIGPCSSSSSGGPQPAIDGVEGADAFGGFSSVAPGSWIEIYGTNFASEAQSWTGADFTGNNAPTSLGGISVSIGGQAAFVDYVSGGQVNVQLPSNIATGGTLPLTLTNGSGTSAPVNLTVNATQPGLFAPTGFQVGGMQYVVAQHADGTYVLPIGALGGVTSRPAQPGETIVMYGVGFGSVTPNIPAGEIATAPNQLVAALTIQFGSTPAQLPLPYAGLAPSSVGLYQFNVVVPLVPDNELVPLTFNLGGTAGTQTLYTAVQQ